MGTQLPARSGSGRSLAARRERELGDLADRQHGVLTRRQLLDAGLGVRTIRRRVEACRLFPLHREVYAFGTNRVNRRGRWLAAVLACGDGAVLSHRSAAALWGLMGFRGDVVEVSSASGRRRPGIDVHEGGLEPTDRTLRDRIPVTTVARTLFDLAEVVDERQLERAFEEAARLRVLEMRALDDVCARCPGRHALRPIRRLLDEAREPTWTRSSLEERFAVFCRDHDLPLPETNVLVLGHEVDALWARQRLVVEADSWSFHRHRAAFERDRARDAAMSAAGYRVVRLTHRRLEREPAKVATELRRLLARGEERAGD